MTKGYETEEDTIDHNESTDHSSPTSWRKRITQTELPPDEEILSHIIELLSDKNVRISKVSEAILKDPVTTLEILYRANSGVHANDKNKVSAVHTAVVRIGSEELLNICKALLERATTTSNEIAAELNVLRSIGCRAGLIAEILSSHLQRDIIEVAQTCALISTYGQMLACYTLKEKYLELAHIKKKSTLNYKLLSLFSFDTAKVQLEYFQKKNLPNMVFFAFDKELKCKTTAQSSLRFVVESAIELSEAQEEDKLSKYKYFHKLPAKSSLRLLKINENAYEYIYSEIEEALGLGSGIGNEEHRLSSESSISSSENQNEDAQTPKIQAESLRVSSTIKMDRSELINFFSSSENAVYIEKDADVIEQERSELSPSAEAIIGMMQSICTNAKSAQELIKDMMEVVIEKGPFIRTAVIELGEGRKEAFIHSALGDDFNDLENLKSIQVKDPLSPLSTVITKVQSFNSKTLQDNISPFGITSYAISPIKSKSETQLVFYADCGTERPLPFEARKVFRLAVALLNDALPKLSL